MVEKKRNMFRRLSVVALVLLSVSIIAFFWLIFVQIDQQLNQFNRSFLRIVNKHKSEVVQRKFNDFESSIRLISSVLESGDLKSLKMIMEQDSLNQVISSSIYWNTVLPTSSASTINAKYQRYSVWRDNQEYELPAFEKDTVRYVNKEYPALEVYKKQGENIVLFDINLLKLHDLLGRQLPEDNAYFEIYDQEGYCIYNPDISKIGSQRLDLIEQVGIKKDTIVDSEFLLLPVVRKNYELNGLFSNTKLFIYAPVMLTEVEVRGIGGSSLLLSISGIGLMLVLLFFLNKERRKSERLAMDNLAYQKEDALLRFENFKAKIDPHFLFNALGSLQHLIGKDTKLAQTFVGKMARVYRKFLSVDASGLATVQEEVLLAKEYCFLQQIRFGEAALEVVFDFDEKLITKQIPRFSLQILVENAIKHNEISIENPLKIRLFLGDNCLLVVNSYVPRVLTEESTGYGTVLIANVYDYYNVKGFYGDIEGDIYKVILPLI